MKDSVFRIVIGILFVQALIYTLLSLGSTIDFFSYVISSNQPNLSFLGFFAILTNSTLGSKLGTYTSLWSVVLSFIGAISFFFLAYIYDYTSKMGRIWVLFAIGTTFWFGGEFMWFYFVLTTGTIPDGITVADISWLLGYPAYFAGLILLNKELALEIKNNVLYSFLGILGFFSIIVLYFLGISLFVAGSPVLDNTIYYLYMVGDLIILLLAGLIFLKFSSGGEIRKSYFLLIIAFLVTAIADLLYAYNYDILGIYETYAFDIVDVLYIWGYTLLIVGPLTYYQFVSKVLSD